MDSETGNNYFLYRGALADGFPMNYILEFGISRLVTKNRSLSVVCQPPTFRTIYSEGAEYNEVHGTVNIDGVNLSFFAKKVTCIDGTVAKKALAGFYTLMHLLPELSKEKLIQKINHYKNQSHE